MLNFLGIFPLARLLPRKNAEIKVGLRLRNYLISLVSPDGFEPSTLLLKVKGHASNNSRVVANARHGAILRGPAHLRAAFLHVIPPAVCGDRQLSFPS